MYITLIESSLSCSEEEIMAAVSQGNAVMGLGWTAGFDPIAYQKVGFTEVPVVTCESQTKRKNTMIGNWMMGIAKNTIHKELVMELITYLTERHTQRLAIEYGALPTRKSIFKDEEVVRAYPYLLKMYAALQTSVVRPRTEHWSSIEAILNEELYDAIQNNKSIDEALGSAKDSIEVLIAPEDQVINKK